MSAPPPGSWWHSWLLPARPGFKQVVIGVVAFVLPSAFVLQGMTWLVPATVLSVTIGCGLGLAWAMMFLRTWLLTAPTSGLTVLMVCFASLANLDLVPRMEAALRALELQREMRAALGDRALGGPATMPGYHTGTGGGRMVEVPDARGSAVIAYTGDALQRWSPFGWRDACYVLLRADGRAEIVATRAELDRIIAHP